MGPGALPLLLLGAVAGWSIASLTHERRVVAAGLPLTDRQLAILSEVARGYTTKEIAARQGVRPSTVRTHVRRSCKALGAPNRTAAVALIGSALRPERPLPDRAGPPRR